MSHFNKEKEKLERIREPKRRRKGQRSLLRENRRRWGTHAQGNFIRLTDPMLIERHPGFVPQHGEGMFRISAGMSNIFIFLGVGWFNIEGKIFNMDWKTSKKRSVCPIFRGKCSTWVSA